MQTDKHFPVGVCVLFLIFCDGYSFGQNEVHCDSGEETDLNLFGNPLFDYTKGYYFLSCLGIHIIRNRSSVLHDHLQPAILLYFYTSSL